MQELAKLLKKASYRGELLVNQIEAKLPHRTCHGKCNFGSGSFDELITSFDSVPEGVLSGVLTAGLPAIG